MTKRERIMAAINGQPVDRVPYSLWYHFRLDPPAGEGMALAELDFYRKHDPDLFKVMHDIPYEMPADLPTIAQSEEWRRLPVLDGKSGNFGQQLATVQQIIVEKGDDGPVVDTVFSIFSTAQKLCGKKTLEFLKSDPDALHVGLKRVATSLANYASAVIEAGADGIYLAISGASSDTMDDETYRANFLQYDKQILAAASEGTVNVLHHHGGGIYPELTLGLSGYQIYCWSDRQAGNPSVREMRIRTTGCLMAGVNEATFGTDSPEQITAQVKDAVQQSGGRAFIAAPGCAVPTPPASPDENLRAVRAGVVDA